ncbi:MAG: sterol desaturase family protein [Bdellovibrionales bacterium]
MKADHFIENPIKVLSGSYYEIIAILFILTLFEIKILSKGPNKDELRDAMLNYFILTASQLLVKVYSGYLMLSMVSKAIDFRVFPIQKGYTSFLLCFFAVDFFYYWRHRLEHRNQLLWSIHVVHHSSHFFNSSLFARASWFSVLYSWIFLVPPVLIGFPISYCYGAYLLLILYQFFAHGKFEHPHLRYLRYLLVIPEDHRLHHSASEEHFGKNYAATFAIWDRVFGTYCDPDKAVVRSIGAPGEPESLNPFRVVVGPVIRYFQRQFGRNTEGS